MVGAQHFYLRKEVLPLAFRVIPEFVTNVQTSILPELSRLEEVKIDDSGKVVIGLQSKPAVAI